MRTELPQSRTAATRRVHAHSVAKSGISLREEVVVVLMVVLAVVVVIVIKKVVGKVVGEVAVTLWWPWC